MEGSFDFWKFLAGIGLFLWGMHQLEHALRELVGRSFKELLQRFTNRPWKGIAVGTVITAILQSSSLVTLMVLAFLGGGMISLSHSLGVVLGANLGTTFTAWIVATLGFKVSVSDFAFPFLALGTLTYLFVNSRPLLRNTGAFLVGFGLLFLGLDFMKEAIESVAEQIDLSDYLRFGLWVFLVLGILVTALIQSSSATIVIVLSALNAQVVDIQHALAMIIGANIGTTFTLILGAIGGTADKKRLALGNFVFKLVAGVITFFFIEEMIFVAFHTFKVEDPLMELVLLNTLINVFGIVIFYPFLGVMERWLRRKFVSDEPQGLSTYIKNVSTEVPSVGIMALEKEVDWLFERTLKFVKKLILKHHLPEKNTSVWKKIIYQPKDLLADYDRLKSLEDELTGYGIGLQEQNLSSEEAAQLTHLMHAMREMIYGAKDFKDIVHNIQQMEASQESLVMELHQELKQKMHRYVNELDKLADSPDELQLLTLYSQLDLEHESMISGLYGKLRHQRTDVPVSSLSNVIKQSFSGVKHLGNALDSRKGTASPPVNEGVPLG
ncbi:MAG: Na/Pi cotransporter family protein [Lunatimonas sp.]|uniref:Na/Pi cotransporter family protein n=1 Tax=Lunatimonas sp. TaxID=2060141 RepID=UPI00263B7734|nr:Na/Pi symporter [Lunatimonas sp.]MCC5935849.1 Na/Pi cotransporter family protein [Lunatimonas sp.]